MNDDRLSSVISRTSTICVRLILLLFGSSHCTVSPRTVDLLVSHVPILPARSLTAIRLAERVDRLSTDTERTTCVLVSEVAEFVHYGNVTQTQRLMTTSRSKV